MGLFVSKFDIQWFRYHLHNVLLEQLDKSKRYPKSDPFRRPKAQGRQNWKFEFSVHVLSKQCWPIWVHRDDPYERKLSHSFTVPNQFWKRLLLPDECSRACNLLIFDREIFWHQISCLLIHCKLHNIRSYRYVIKKFKFSCSKLNSSL